MPDKDFARPVIFGEVLYDRFPNGSVVLGGAPFNVAWHLHAFGESPLFISRVGNDSLGRRIRSGMEAWGMSTAGLQLDSQHPTGTVEVSIEGGEPAYDIVADRAYDYIGQDGIPPVTPSLLYHGTLALRNSVSAQALAALKHRLDMPIFLDVNLRPPWWNTDLVKASLDAARWAKLNEHELEAMVADAGARGLPAQAALVLEQHGLELLIVTRGASGAIAFTAEGAAAEVQPRSGTPIVDTVGAGDAFTSVAIAGLVRGWPLPQLMERAQDFASTLVGVRGATIQDEAFYRPFIESWE